MAFDEYQQISQMIKEHGEAVTNLVEENKHYTTSSKYLSEAPVRLKQEYHSYETKAEVLAAGVRQMSVTALNAAVEAGRMGNAGKQFVEVAEEIRQSALYYEETALAMKDELQKSQERVQELEEYVLRLVSLIKDGNVNTTRLMKKSMELNKKVSNCSMRDFSEPMLTIRDKVVSMRNLDEEMAKLSERNKIQLGDIQEELQMQKQALDELENDLSYMLDEACDKIRK
jgi:methyl-accepting chemotaxis protein